MAAEGHVCERVDPFLCNTDPNHPMRISPVPLVSAAPDLPLILNSGKPGRQSALPGCGVTWAMAVLAGKDLIRQQGRGEGEAHEQVKVVGLALLGSQPS